MPTYRTEVVPRSIVSCAIAQTANKIKPTSAGCSDPKRTSVRCRGPTINSDYLTIYTMSLTIFLTLTKEKEASQAIAGMRKIAKVP
jgi:hypothetical protein